MENLHNFGHMARNFRLLKIHLRLAKSLRNYEKEKYLDFTFRPAKLRDLKAIKDIHSECMGQSLFDWLYRIYFFKARELISVCEDKNGKIVACDMFMFQEVELGEDILHELYVEVLPEYQKQGLATAMRRYCVKSYKAGHKLKGLSTLALFDDIKALRTAQKAGYAITKASAKPPAYYLFQHI